MFAQDRDPQEWRTKPLVPCSRLLEAQPYVGSCILAGQSHLYVPDNIGVGTRSVAFYEDVVDQEAFHIMLSSADSNEAIEAQILGLDIKEMQTR